MTEEMKNKRSIWAIFFALLGIIVNMLLALSYWKDSKSQYDNYLENIEIYGKRDTMTLFRLSLYKLDKLFAIFTIFCIVIYILVIIFQKVRPFYLLIPACGIAATFYSLTLIDYASTSKGKLLFYVAIAIFIVTFIFTLIGVINKKVRFALFAGLCSLLGAGAVIAAILIGFNLSDDVAFIFIPLANIFGSLMIFLIVLNSMRERKAKPVATPKPAPVNAPMPASVPVLGAVPPAGNVANGSTILSADTLIIDEKVSWSKKSFKLFNAYGTQIGYATEKLSGGAKAARFFFGKKIAIFQSAEIQVCDMNGTIIFGVHKKGQRLSIADANGNTICTIKNSCIKDSNGNDIFKLHHEFKAGYLIKTMDDRIVANYKKDLFTAKAIFTSADKYTLTITPGIPANYRIHIVGTTFAYEMVMGNT